MHIAPVIRNGRRLLRLCGIVGLTLGLFVSLWLGLGTFTAPPSVQAANFDLTGACPSGVGDVATLIATINTANTNGAADTITLAAGCVYTLTAVDNTNDGAN